MPTFGTMSALIGPNDLTRTAPRVPDRVSVWPLEADRFGIDVIYDGATGYELASRHEASLEAAGIPHSSRQEARRRVDGEAHHPRRPRRDRRRAFVGDG